MSFYIYITTNLINGKRYIGQHKGEVNDSYLGSGVLFSKALEKYGKENFKKEILEECSEEELNEKERYWIKKFNALEDESFYNLTEGGQEGDGWQACQRYMLAHPDFSKEVYKENGRRVHEWLDNHPEVKQQNINTMLDAAHRWQKDHPEEVKKHMKKVNEAKEKWQKEHPEEYQKEIDRWRKAGSIANSRKVVCTTTGEVFESVSSAARHYGLAQPNISKVLKGERKSCGKLEDGTKLKWQWYNE